MGQQGEASDLMRGLSRVAGPEPRIANKIFIDPALTSEPDAVDRDFATSPISFVSVGTIQGNSAAYCAPGPGYDGPCTDQAVDFSGWRRSELNRFAQKCGVGRRESVTVITPHLAQKVGL